LLYSFKCKNSHSEYSVIILIIALSGLNTILVFAISLL
jgi:hypothetical protein